MDISWLLQNAHKTIFICGVHIRTKNIIEVFNFASTVFNRSLRLVISKYLIFKPHN